MDQDAVEESVAVVPVRIVFERPCEAGPVLCLGLPRLPVLDRQESTAAGRDGSVTTGTVRRLGGLLSASRVEGGHEPSFGDAALG
jgi:hypothetical protein